MDWGYIAGYFDGEGSAGVWNLARGRNTGRRRGGIVWTNTHRESLDTMQSFMGCGTVRSKTHRNPRWKTCYSLHIDNRQDLMRVIPHLLDHCIVKRDRLLEVLEWATHECGELATGYGNLAAVGAEEIRRLYWDEGLTQQQIGERFGVGHTGVRQYMRRHDIPTRDRGLRSQMANRESQAWANRNAGLADLRRSQWQDPEYRARMIEAMKAGRQRRIDSARDRLDG